MKLNSLSTYMDIPFILKFLILLPLLYYFHIGFNGIVSPEGPYYSALLDNAFNYIKLFRYLMLFGASSFVEWLGIGTAMEGTYIINLENGGSVIMWLPCLGLGIISFWVAFVVSHAIAPLKKLWWCVIGILAIWFLNCARVILVLLSIEKEWQSLPYFNHHDIFNLFSYAAIFFLLYLFLKKESKESAVVKQI
jgi:exosortase/archaeosortase family protein